MSHFLCFCELELILNDRATLTRDDVITKHHVISFLIMVNT